MRTSARRTGAVAAAAAIVLLVGGCGSDDDDGKGDGKESGAKGGFDVPDPGDKRPDLDDEPGGDGPPTGEDGGADGGSVDPTAVAGSWSTAPDVEGDSVVFDVGSDNSVDMIIPGHCKGTLSGKTIDLSCTEGKKSYTHGVIKSSSAKNMTVAWSNGRTTELQKYGGPHRRTKPDSPSDFPSAEDPF
ncbi:hypothetical protein ITI46_12650 [Streptomyces oryzae]|uniref:Lipoprotein n=1 Tax=Streptomyces oryzae TaxID=1434886 RepID=A0ABS3XAX0_9ACTN|nr:hypothetical protein [Streptomyces oryzae]MBO8192508.1 hypothetical protein [Streptomyces oryzae]